MNLLRYIKGQRRGKEAHLIELEAMKDSFLSEALEGYDAIDDDHLKRISRLQKQVKSQTSLKSGTVAKKPLSKPKAKLKPKQNPVRKEINITWKKWGVAATVLLCLSLGGYYLIENYDFPKFAQQPQVVVQNEQEQREIEIAPAKQDTFLIYLPPSKLPKNDLTASAQIDKETRDFDKSIEAMRLEIPQMELKVNEVKPAISVEVKNLMAKEDFSIKSIKGKVTDNTGEPLIGVSVRQKGQPTGTITDIDGNFSLGISNNKPVTFDYLGFERAELSPDTNKFMLVAMNENSQTLDEVVVVGYGKVDKRMFTGSVSSVSASKEKSTKPEPEMGMKAYKNYLKTSVIHPTDSICNGVKGTVKLRFLVNIEGNPYNIQVVKSLCPTSDSEAVRLIQWGGKWKYGTETVEIEVPF